VRPEYRPEDDAFPVSDAQGKGWSGGCAGLLRPNDDLPMVRVAGRNSLGKLGLRAEGDQLFQVVVTPVYESAGGTALWRLVAGYRVDDGSSAVNGSQPVGAEYVFRYGRFDSSPTPCPQQAKAAPNWAGVIKNVQAAFSSEYFGAFQAASGCRRPVGRSTLILRVAGGESQPTGALAGRCSLWGLWPDTRPGSNYLVARPDNAAGSGARRAAADNCRKQKLRLQHQWT